MDIFRAGSISNAAAFQAGDGGANPTTALHLRKQDYLVKPCDLRLGQAMVREYHYSKGGSNTAVYMHGLFERSTDRLVGVAWWLPPTRVACESVNRQEWKKVLSLTRLVIIPGQPTNSASFLLSKSVLLIRRGGRFVSLVTYADESQGHTGGIYRASNWEYVGKTGPYVRWVDPESGRQVACKATVNRTKAQMQALGLEKSGSFFKHKYCLHL